MKFAIYTTTREGWVFRASFESIEVAEQIYESFLPDSSVILAWSTSSTIVPPRSAWIRFFKIPGYLRVPSNGLHLS